MLKYEVDAPEAPSVKFVLETDPYGQCLVIAEFEYDDEPWRETIFTFDKNGVVSRAWLSSFNPLPRNTDGEVRMHGEKAAAEPKCCR